MTVERHAIPPGMRLHPLRAGDLTASDIGAAFGLDPWRPALRIYGEKTGELQPQAETPPMRRGRLLEAAAVEALREELPDWDIRRPGVYLRDPDIRLGATPDVIAEDPGEPGLVNIQIKCMSPLVFERDWPGPDGAPLTYQLQTAAEGMLLDARASLLAAFVVDAWSAELHLRSVPRHAGAEARIRAMAVEFWDNIAKGLRPAPDFSRDAETIAELFPKAEAGKVLDLSGDNRLLEILPEREKLKARIETDKAAVESIESEIKFKIGDAEIAELPGWRLTWKNEHRRAYTVAESDRRPLKVRKVEEQEKAA